MASDSEGEKSPTAKKPSDPGGLSLAFALTILAGVVDAVSYLHWHGLFVSFMSGNSTVLGVHTAQAETAKALLAAAVIAGFVVGVTAGELLTTAIGRRVAEVVLLLEAVLLATGAVLLHGNASEFLVAPMLSFTMGLHNAAVHRGGGISVSLTYVTGALVHVGRSVAKAIQGQSSWSAALPYLLLWFGLVLGAAAGAFVAGKSETLALALAAGVAALLSLLAATCLSSKRPALNS